MPGDDLEEDVAELLPGAGEVVVKPGRVDTPAFGDLADRETLPKPQVEEIGSAGRFIAGLAGPGGELHSGLPEHRGGPGAVVDGRKALTVVHDVMAV